MENLEECMKYFREQDYKRIFSKMRKKYESFGKWEGNIVIDNPKDTEKEALTGFMKKDYSNNKTISLSVKKFEERLKETRFSDIPLKTIIEKYDGKPLVSKKLKLEREKEEEKAFYKEILSKEEGSLAYPVLKKLLEENNHFLKVQYVVDKENLKKAIQNACICFNRKTQQSENEASSV